MQHPESSVDREDQDSPYDLESELPRPMDLRARRVFLKPRGCNLILENCLYGRIPPEGLKGRVNLFSDEKRTKPRLDLRRRRGLELHAWTVDLLQPREGTADYVLGSLRRHEVSAVRAARWELVGWNEDVLGEFVEESGRGKGFVVPGAWLTGARYTFRVNGEERGFVERHLRLWGMETTAHFDLTPQDRRFSLLFEGVVACFAAVAEH